MKFETPLIKGTLLKRYKRFLSDIKLEDGSIVIAHCTNSGSMKTCIEENAPVYVSPAKDPKRKTKFTWEMIFINNGWIGINTGHPNKIVYEAVLNGEIEKLKGYTHVKREVKFEDSRFDVYAENDKEQCFIEVKNVSMKEGEWALFPDAVTTRGQKHLRTLMEVKKQGMRAVMVYIIQRADVSKFGPAKEVDPVYAATLKEAYENGVEIIPLIADVSPEEIKIKKEIPFFL